MSMITTPLLPVEESKELDKGERRVLERGGISIAYMLRGGKISRESKDLSRALGDDHAACPVRA